MFDLKGDKVNKSLSFIDVYTFNGVNEVCEYKQKQKYVYMYLCLLQTYKTFELGKF